MPESIWQAHLITFKAWLLEQNISPHTKRVYMSQVQQFVMFLASSDYDNNEGLFDSNTFARAVQDYRDFLKNKLKVGSSSINNSLIAIQHFSSVLGIPAVKIERERRKKWKPKVLTENQQEMFLQAVRKQELIRDQALALILYCAGIRISECADLNTEDVLIDNSGIRLLIKHTETDGHVEVKESHPLNADAAQALQIWLSERNRLVADSTETALWIGQQGQRLSIPGIDFVLRRIGWQARMTLSAETLRRTSIAKLTSPTHKADLATEVGEHLSLNTVKRFGISGNSKYQKALAMLKGAI